MKNKLILLVLTLLLCNVFSNAANNRLNLNESRFYTDVIPRDTVYVTNLTGANNDTDSRRINTIIANKSARGGGFVVLKPHNNKNTFYLGNITLKNKVHLQIAPSVTIKGRKYGGEDLPVFNIGRDGKVENVAVTCLKPNSSKVRDYFKLHLKFAPNSKQYAVNIRHAKNFLVSGINISDNYTSISNITVNLRDTEKVNQRPTKGKIQNILSKRNHVGYGVVQCKAAKTVLFKNLNGEGGVTLRFESGSAEYGSITTSTINDVVGKKIKCKNGDAALNLSPHRITQGQIDITGVSTTSCAFAVQITGGYYDEGGSRSLANNLGTFSENSYIQISSVVAGNKAQIKTKDIAFFPCGSERSGLERRKKSNPDQNSVYGRSIGIIRTNADEDHGCSSTSGPRLERRGCYKPRIVFPSSINARSFVRRGNYSYYTDKIEECPGSSAFQTGNTNEFTGESISASDKVFAISTDNNVLNMAQQFTYSMWPNPASDQITIDCPEGSEIKFFDTSNQLIKQLTDTDLKPTVNISDLPSGIVLVKVKFGNKSITKKLLVR